MLTGLIYEFWLTDFKRLSCLNFDKKQTNNCFSVLSGNHIAIRKVSGLENFCKTPDFIIWRLTCVFVRMQDVH